MRKIHKIMCCEPSGFTEDQIDGVCPDCVADTVDGDAYESCSYSPCECKTCNYRPCDQSC